MDTDSLLKKGTNSHTQRTHIIVLKKYNKVTGTIKMKENQFKSTMKFISFDPKHKTIQTKFLGKMILKAE